MYHYTESGLSNIYLVNGVNTEIEDGEEYTSIDNMDGLHKAIALAIVDSKRPLTHEEFKFLRVELNQSQVALAKHFDVTEQTIARYEKNQTKIPRTTDAYLRSLHAASMGKNHPVSYFFKLFSDVKTAASSEYIHLNKVNGDWKKVDLYEGPLPRVCIFNRESSNSFIKSKESYEKWSVNLFGGNHLIAYAAMDNPTTDTFLEILDKSGDKHNKLVCVMDNKSPINSAFLKASSLMLSQSNLLSISHDDFKFAFKNCSLVQYSNFDSTNIEYFPNVILDKFAVIVQITAHETFPFSEYKKLETLARDAAKGTPYLLFSFVIDNNLPQSFKMELFNFFEESKDYPHVIKLIDEDLNKEKKMTRSPINIDNEGHYPKQVRCKNPQHEYWDEKNAFNDDGECGECVEKKYKLSKAEQDGYDDDVIKMNDG